MTDTETIDAAVRAAQEGPYARVFILDDDGRFAAEVLEFPGCFSSGDSAEEAMANLDEAIELWIEAEIEDGHEIPKPLQDTEFSGRLTLRLPPSIHERAAVLAQREGVSLNRFLSAAVAYYVGLATEHPAPPSPTPLGVNT